MLTFQEKQILEELPKTQYGQVLFKFLEEEYTLIGDIMTVKSNEELLGRQHAVKLVKKLFNFMEEPPVDKPKKSSYT